MTNFNPDNPDFQLVKSKKCVINGAKDFAEYANKIMVFLAFTWPKTRSRQSLKVSQRHQKFQEH